MATNKKTSTKKTTTKKQGPVKKKISNASKTKKNNNLVDKKTLFYAMISVAVLTTLFVSATFAYFLVGYTNESETIKIDMQAEDVGNVIFNSSNEKLSLDLSVSQMLQLGKDVAYYASKEGTTVTETNETMGNIKVVGPGVFNCSYTLKIDAKAKSEDSNMYNKFQSMAEKTNDQIVLVLNTRNGEEIFDFNDDNLFPIEYSGKANGLKDGVPEEIKAQLKIVNKTGIVQNKLKGTNISLEFTVEGFGCELVG